MNNTQKNIFALAVLACAAYVPAATAVTPYYSIRSQGVNTVRELVGWQDLINLCDECKFYGAFAIAAEYSQTFRSNRICECLFGSNNFTTNTSGSVVANNSCNTNCNTGCNDSCNGCVIGIAGSCATGDTANTWLADYFGLPTDFTSVVKFSPRIRNFVADVEFYVGLDEWTPGLWFRLNLPITNTRWDLRFCETVTNAGENSYVAGYFAPEIVERAQLLTNATEFFSGCAIPTFGSDSDIVFQPLRYGKWATDNCSCNGLSKTRLADLEAALGYNFVCSENGYFGLSLRTEAPTGNRPEGEYLFEPIVGNGHHWTLGVGVNAKAVLWNSCEDDSNFSFYLDANIVHFFKTCQTRTFDLCSQGANSRYMLAQKLEESTGGLFGGGVGTDGTAATLQFANEFAPVANITASQVDVSVSVQGDVTFKFAYQNDCGLTWDLGYNFWGKACEDICRKAGCNGNIVLGQWALKGDAAVYGFCSNSSDCESIALVATQSGATIESGLNYADQDCDTFVNVNANIDTPVLAYGTRGTIVASPLGLDQTNISSTPVVLTEADINLAAVRGISNKLFTHLNYTWKDNEDWLPFLGVGASVEFGQGCNSGCGTSCDTNCNTNCNTNSNCGSSCGSSCNDNSSCNRCSISQWAVWVKGGIAFN